MKKRVLSQLLVLLLVFGAFALLSGTMIHAETTDAITITEQPTSVSAKVGDTATFSVTAIGEDLTYQWQYSKDGTTWGNWAKGASINVEATAGRSGYQFRCVLTDANGETLTSDVATLTVFAIKTQPKAASAKVGDIATFSVTATGEGLTYQWQYSKDGTTWGNWAKGASINVEATTGRNGYQFRCVITDASGEKLTSKAVKLTVFMITAQPKAASAKVGNNATFSVTATGTGLTYQWQYSKDGTTWSNWAKGASISVEATAGRNGYQFRCVITNSKGETLTSKAVKLTVFAITTQPKAASVGVKDTVKFSVKATGTGLTYQWQYSKDGTTWSNWAKGASISVEATTGRNGYQFRCVITDANGEKLTSKAVKLTVFMITAQPKAASVKVGNNATFSVTATGTGLTYQWQYSKDGTTWRNWAKGASISVEATGARNGYQYRCVITDSANRTATSEAVTLKVVFPAPKNLTVSRYSWDSLYISFDEVNAATAYEIYRNGKKIATITDTYYIDEGLKTGTYYSYKVRACFGSTSYRSSATSVVEERTYYKPNFDACVTTTHGSSTRLVSLYIYNKGELTLTIGGSRTTNFCLFYPYSGASYTEGILQGNDLQDVIGMRVGPGVSGTVYWWLESSRYVSDGASMSFYFEYDGVGYVCAVDDEGTWSYRSY